LEKGASEDMASEIVAGNHLEEERRKRADRFFDEDLKGQRKWYSERASLFKKRSFQTSFLIISAGATIAAIGTFQSQDTHWVGPASAMLGGLVAILKGWEQIVRYDETWMAYRIASERMKRQYRLYTNNCGQYPDFDTEDDAFQHFVETIESIIAEEQQIFWSQKSNTTSKDKKDVS
jgi:hypothetical protein